ncbi:cobalamin biosynthesis protein CobQ [Rhodophyticola sp. CCM32]|uniref:cobalamin biosynthesis protein CobQ n=1 Tax=Rhodophyticola sp. CCM32 TaxID=2916397 RepID=UPI00107F46C9|nr:cobalamin biosynthesis protein CobQ [Rhodophyticola sp. CCM32]QBY01750.1 cobalamin biosynthesis protein CobQ [Rhodophyticola sp. CCM32]
MNTPAHLLLGAAVFGDPERRHTTTAALIGGLLPDLSLYLMAGVSLILLEIPPQVVFGELYYSEAWQHVFAIDNSMLVWGLVFGLGLWLKRAWVVALAGAALLHLVTDFALHHDDGRSHFWPLTSWVFESPISYWDSHHGARYVAPLEGLLSAICAAVLWRRYVQWGARFGFIAILGLEGFVIRQWLVFF